MILEKLLFSRSIRFRITVPLLALLLLTILLSLGMLSGFHLFKFNTQSQGLMSELQKEILINSSSKPLNEEALGKRIHKGLVELNALCDEDEIGSFEIKKSIDSLMFYSEDDEKSEMIYENLQKLSQMLEEQVQTKRTHTFYLLLVCCIMALLTLIVIIVSTVRILEELLSVTSSLQVVVSNHYSRKYKLNAFTGKDEIGDLSGMISQMLEKVHIQRTTTIEQSNEIRRNYQDLKLLGAIGRNITSKLELSEIIDTVFCHINQLMPVSFLVVGIWDEKLKNMEMYSMNDSGMQIRKGYCPLSNPAHLCSVCFMQQKEIFENSDHPITHCICFGGESPSKKSQSFIYIPLTIHDNRQGLLSVQSHSSGVYTNYHLEMLRHLSNYICIALLNGKTYRTIITQNNDLEIVTQSLKIATEHLEALVEIKTAEISKQKDEIENKNKELVLRNVDLARLSIVAEQSENAFMIMDSQGNIQWINKFFTQIYEYDFDSFIRARGSNIINTSFYPGIKNILQRCIETKKAVSYNALNITKDGNPIWTRTTLSPILNENKEIEHLVTVDSDITRIKVAEGKILEQSEKITQNILYAKKIQEALFTPMIQIKEWIPDHFIFNHPKDIVSGDFYWVAKRENKIFIAVADCTGHGVTGALMSVLGMTLFTEIISTCNDSSPGMILNSLRVLLKKALRGSSHYHNTSDGMDVALCVIDPSCHELVYAGANRPFYLIRDHQLTEYQPDKMPVALHMRDTIPFFDHLISYLPGDMIYMFTDGYCDQFGGPNHKKFMKKNLNILLLEMCSLPVLEQHASLKKTLNDYMGSDNEQVDDILVMGIRL